MKIIYENGVYHINTEYPETEFHVCTNNIADAKKHYIDMLMSLFDETVCKQFKENKLNLF